MSESESESSFSLALFAFTAWIKIYNFSYNRNIVLWTNKYYLLAANGFDNIGYDAVVNFLGNISILKEINNKKQQNFPTKIEEKDQS